MTGRRAIVGLTMLCALVFSAVAAQGASALKTTTAYECAAIAPGVSGKEFKDEHCDTAESGTGGFKHVAIAPGVKKEITGTNEKTKNETKEAEPSILKTTLLTIPVEIKAKKVTGTGTLENKEGPPMSAEGTGNIEYSELEVIKPSKCKVKEPIVAPVKASTKVINEEAGKEEMGVEFSPTGENFTTITFEDKSATEKCAEALKTGSPFKVKGTAIGTPGGTVNGHGATLVFTEAMTEKTLTVGGSKASIAGTITLRIKGGGAVTATTSEP